VDLATDQANCGACGEACPAFGVCAAGACTAVSCRGEVGFPGVPDLVGPRTFTVAAVDVDRDGLLDLVVAPVTVPYGTQDGTLQLLRNLGARRFAPPVSLAVGFAVSKVRTGDVDGDGRLDVVAGGSGGEVAVLRGTAAGGLAAATAPQPMGGADDLVLADLDGDGRADVITAWNGISVRLGTPSGAFGPRTDYWSTTPMFNPHSAAVGDLNGDGLPDVVGADDQAGKIGVYLNAGGGVLSAVVPYDVRTEVFKVALADVDGDGHLDVIGAAYDSLVVLLNAGDGTLRAPVFYQTGYGNYSIAVSDFDGDGHPDVALGNWGDRRRVDVFRNAGDGTFLPPESFFDEGAAEITAADLDADGRMDLVVASSAGLGVHLLWNAGTTFLQAGFSPAPFTPYDLVLGDVDGDGTLDVVAVDYASGKGAVLRGAGDGTFTLVQRFDASGIVVGDLDGDGDIDVVAGVTLPTGGTVLRVYRSDGGVLAVAQELPFSPPRALADLDGDGALDVVAQDLASPAREVVWLRGRGDGTFEDPAVLGAASGAGLWSFATGDLDGNGWPDLIAMELDGPIHVWLNLGGGSFVHSSFATGARGSDLALGDLNGDGVLDVAFASVLDDGVVVLLGAGDGTFVESPVLPYYGATAVKIGAPAGRAQSVILVRGPMTEEVGIVEVGAAGTLTLAGRWATRGGYVPLAFGDIDGDLRPDVVMGAVDGIAVRRAACLP
jgi:hypothetical protein